LTSKKPPPAALVDGEVECGVTQPQPPQQRTHPGRHLRWNEARLVVGALDVGPPVQMRRRDRHREHLGVDHGEPHVVGFADALLHQMRGVLDRRPRPVGGQPVRADRAGQSVLAVWGAGQPLGLGVTAKDTESLRAKLKRLVARQVLAETEPGLFTLATAKPSA
jgi:hypothetical protein